MRTTKNQFADAGSAATILKMAIECVEGFDVLYRRFERQMSIAGRSKSTITNYGRHIAAIALHFQCLPAKRHSDYSTKARRKRNGRLLRQRNWDGRLIAVHAASNSPWYACSTSTIEGHLHRLPHA